MTPRMCFALLRLVRSYTLLSAMLATSKLWVFDTSACTLTAPTQTFANTAKLFHSPLIPKTILSSSSTSNCTSTLVSRTSSPSSRTGKLNLLQSLKLSKLQFQLHLQLSSTLILSQLQFQRRLQFRFTLFTSDRLFFLKHHQLFQPQLYSHQESDHLSLALRFNAICSLSL